VSRVRWPGDRLLTAWYVSLQMLLAGECLSAVRTVDHFDDDRTAPCDAPRTPRGGLGRTYPEKDGERWGRQSSAGRPGRINSAKLEGSRACGGVERGAESGSPDTGMKYQARSESCRTAEPFSMPEIPGPPPEHGPPVSRVVGVNNWTGAQRATPGVPRKTAPEEPNKICPGSQPGR
jgi:hypothetical protein